MLRSPDADWQAEYEKHQEFAEAVRRAAIAECAGLVEAEWGNEDNGAAIASFIRGIK